MRGQGQVDLGMPGDIAETETTWHADAACASCADAVNFFPTRGESARDAKAVCAACPVREPCLEFALATRMRFGVWGGLSERERRAVIRERRRRRTY